MTQSMMDEARPSHMTTPAIAKFVPTPPRWFLALLCAIDKNKPGIAARVLGASDARRQVAAACLAAAISPSVVTGVAATECQDDAEQWHFDLGRVGDPATLLTWRLGRVLEQAFGTNPAGFTKAVAKSGPSIHEPDYYMDLHAAFTSPGADRLAVFLKRAPELDALTVKMALRLPSELLHWPFFARLDFQELKAVAKALPALRSALPDVPETEWIASLRRLARHSNPRSFTAAWLKRAKMPPPPIEGDDDVWPLASVDMMLEAARRFRNCLRDYVVGALRGEHYFYEARLLGAQAVVQLDRRQQGGWIFEAAYGPDNNELPDAAARAIREWFVQRGVESEELSVDAWYSLERLWLGTSK